MKKGVVVPLRPAAGSYFCRVALFAEAFGNVYDSDGCVLAVSLQCVQ